MDYERQFKEILTILRKFVGGMRSPLEDDSPKYNDPSKYDRSVKIEDGDTLMMITHADELMAKARTAHAEADLAMSEAKTASKRLFIRLNKVYPNVGSPLHAGVGYRKYKGDYYFVSWNDADAQDEEEDGTPDPQ